MVLQFAAGKTVVRYARPRATDTQVEVWWCFGLLLPDAHIPRESLFQGTQNVSALQSLKAARPAGGLAKAIHWNKLTRCKLKAEGSPPSVRYLFQAAKDISSGPVQNSEIFSSQSQHLTKGRRFLFLPVT